MNNERCTLIHQYLQLQSESICPARGGGGAPGPAPGAARRSPAHALSGSAAGGTRRGRGPGRPPSQRLRLGGPEADAGQAAGAPQGPSRQLPPACSPWTRLRVDSGRLWRRQRPRLPPEPEPEPRAFLLGGRVTS